MPIGYDVRKAAQVVAFLINAQGGEADLIKTVKLAYLADRRSLELYDAPILNDDFYCLDNGPVNSTTYDYIKGQGTERHIWTKYVKPREGNILKSVRRLPNTEYELLSESEEDILQEVVKKYRRYRPFQLVDLIHRTCPEWKHPGGSSNFMPYSEVFKALGKAGAASLERHVQELRTRKSSLLAA